MLTWWMKTFKVCSHLFGWLQSVLHFGLYFSSSLKISRLPLVLCGRCWPKAPGSAFCWGHCPEILPLHSFCFPQIFNGPCYFIVSIFASTLWRIPCSINTQTWLQQWISRKESHWGKKPWPLRKAWADPSCLSRLTPPAPRSASCGPGS